MTVFTRQLDTAKRLIAAKGETCTLYKPSVETDSETPWYDSNTDAPIAHTVVIVWTRGTMDPRQDVDIPSETIGGLIAGKDLAVTPQYRDVIARTNGDVYYIFRITQISPDGPAILFKFWATR